MTRWSLFLQTLSLLHHFLGLYFHNATDVSHTCNIFSPPQYNGVPAYAPIEYVFDPEPTDPFHPDVLGLNVRPLAEQVQSFHWWAMDDIGLDRFIGTLEITERDLKQTADDHPSDAARILSPALLDLLQDHTAVNNDAPGPQIQHWSGHPLYDRLDEALLRHGSSICKMYAELAMADLTNKQWLNMENKADLPLNFMPELWPKIVTEMARWMKARSRPFHPHIHIVWDDPSAGGGRQSIIRVRWLKRLPLTQPILVLDATGRVDLLAKAFGIPEGLIEVTERVDTPAFPDTMKVTQWWDGPHTKQHLRGHRDKYRQLLIDELSSRRAAWTDPKLSKVGLITFKEFVPYFKEALAEAGFDKTHREVDYYWNVRGSNSFTDCDLLVIIGYPIPNPQGLYEEACALFSNDSDLISSERQSFNMVMKLRNDRTFTIDGIPGYKDSRLQALYEQKSVSELYQAFHRARPYGKTKVREVLLFTDVPVEDVPVDSFLEREGRLLDSLRDLVNGQGRATLRQLRKAVWESHPQDWSSRENIRMWTDRHLPWIVTASGTEWAPDPTKPDLGEFRTSSSST